MQPFSVDNPLGAPAGKKPIAPGRAERVPNPYRAPKPKGHDVLFKGNYEVRLSGGLLAQDVAAKIVLSPLYLWIDSGSTVQGITVPLSMISDLSFTNDGAFLVVSFYDSLNEADMEVSLRPRNFMNIGAKEKLAEFKSLLERAWKAAPSPEEFMGAESGDSAYVTLGCEKGDSDPAALIDVTTYAYVGIPVVASLSRTVTAQHLLCQRHGSRKGIWYALGTGVFGYLGVIGPFVAPFMAVKNARALKRVYPESSSWLVALAAGFTLPLLLLGAFAIYKLLTSSSS